MNSELLVSDYLNRLERAADVLPRDRRVELVAEVRAHIDTSLVEAGRSDEATVRNVLDRLGSPEEIMAGEAGRMAEARRGSDQPALGVSGHASRWGAIEVAAFVLLGLAWPALLLPFGLALWVGLGLGGVALVWASGAWRTRQKLIITLVVAALYGITIMAFMPRPGPVDLPSPSPIVIPAS